MDTLIFNLKATCDSARQDNRLYTPAIIQHKRKQTHAIPVLTSCLCKCYSAIVIF